MQRKYILMKENMLKCAHDEREIGANGIYDNEGKRKAGRGILTHGVWRANIIYELLQEHGTGLARSSLIHDSPSGCLA